jgi:hypothetical protein
VSLLPLLRTGSEDTSIPSEAALRHAIAAIMRKSGSPDIIDDVGMLLQKWNNLADHPGRPPWRVHRESCTCLLARASTTGARNW